MAAAIALADGRKVKILDDCDPTDPDWAPTGGCVLREGDVNEAEFRLFLFSPLTVPSPESFVIGHPAWRNEPSFLKIKPNEKVKVENEGGRGHTFTEVAAFGGGIVPVLNQGLTPAPECAAATPLPPGARTEVTGLSEGDHLFQCCIHPWMRALIKVQPEIASSKATGKHH
jgi:plastocyanin